MAENNVSYMNDCVYLKLDISIWTGKARLTPEDIPDAVVDMHHIVSGLELHELLECERHL